MTPNAPRNAIQGRIQSLLDDWVARGLETGAQIAVIHEGKWLVDAWAGLADSSTGARVGARTLFPAFSVTKGVTATLVHLLAERGLLDYDAPIAKVWPEFGKNGKAGITLRHALTHSAGVPRLPNDLPPEDLADWEKMCGLISGLTPLWEPGTHVEYHALTSGWIWGEVMRRVDGRGFGELLRDEIKQPLGLSDFHVGLPAELESRVAILEEIGEPWKPAENPPAFASVPDSLQPLNELMNQSAARRAILPAASGIFTARDLARFYAALLPGGIDGVELLPPSRVETALSGCPLGYETGEPESALGDARSFGHAGHGGSVAFADLRRGFAFAFVRNRLRGPDQPDTRRLLADFIRSEWGRGKFSGHSRFKPLEGKS